MRRAIVALVVSACAAGEDTGGGRRDDEVGPTPGGLCLVQGCRADAAAAPSAPGSDAAVPSAPGTAAPRVMDAAPGTVPPAADGTLDADAVVPADASADAVVAVGDASIAPPDVVIPEPPDAGDPVEGPCAPRLHTPCEIPFDACCPAGEAELICYPDNTGTPVWQPVPGGFVCECETASLDTFATCEAM